MWWYSSILLKEETDFIEPQLLWNHTKSEIFVIWRIGKVYCTSLICLWNIFFPTENDNFCENIQIRRPLSFRVLTCSRMPNWHISQSKIEDIVHVQFARLNDICPSYSAAQKWNGHWTCRNDNEMMCEHRQTTFGPTGALPVLCALYFINWLN